LSILRINPPKFGGGLKFEPDPRGIGYAFHGASAGIGQKGAFCRGLFITIVLENFLIPAFQYFIK